MLRDAFNKTYPFGGKERHADHDPASLAGAESEGLGDAEGIHDLERHDGGVPVREVLRGGGCGTVPEGLDGQEVDGICQVLAGELRVVE